MEKNSPTICLRLLNRLVPYRRMVIVISIILAAILFLLLMTRSDPTMFPKFDLNLRNRLKSVQFLNNDDDDADVTVENKNVQKICSMKENSEWKIPNFVWQMLQHRHLTYFLFGAYWDSRKEDETAIRIVAMISEGNIKNTRLFCHLWYPENDEDSPVIMLATLKIIWYNDDLSGRPFLPYLISCPVPANFDLDSIPYAVSLAGSYTICSNVTNLLPIIYEPLRSGEVKKNFAICHKALYYNQIDVSPLLIEWIEIHRILGVDKIIIYEYPGTSHPNISKVLTHYAVTDQNFVQVKPYTLPGKNLLSPQETMSFIRQNGFDKWLNELIPYHDCFYRSMHHYKYIVLVDVDEVIIPVNGTSWSVLLKDISSLAKSQYPDTTISAFTFENHVFLDDIHGNDSFKKRFPQFPAYMHMMQNTWMVHQLGGGGRKAFFSTEAALLLHNHDTFHCLQAEGGCLDYSVEDEVARLHHYMWQGAKDQVTMKGWLDENETAVEDRGIWKYGDRLVPAVTNVFDQISWIQSRDVFITDLISK